MLGPSGSGKTTTLRMTAGFETPDEGTIELAEEDVSGLPPYERPVNTVFQDYALFPHMTVQDNVEYGLRVTGVKKGERQTRAQEALAMVRLPSYGGRKPAQLSPLRQADRSRPGLSRSRRLSGGRLNLTPDRQYGGPWAGQKVFWYVLPSYRGRVLIRGRRLDGRQWLGFDGTRVPERELRIEPYESVSWAGQPHGSRGRPSAVRVKVSGCFAVQIDGVSFSRVVVFAVVAP